MMCWGVVSTQAPGKASGSREMRFWTPIWRLRWSRVPPSWRATAASVDLAICACCDPARADAKPHRRGRTSGYSEPQDCSPDSADDTAVPDRVGVSLGDPG